MPTDREYKQNQDLHRTDALGYYAGAADTVAAVNLLQNQGYEASATGVYGQLRKSVYHVHQALAQASDMASDYHQLLVLVQEKLGVSREPHQTVEERLLERAGEAADDSDTIHWIASRLGVDTLPRNTFLSRLLDTVLDLETMAAVGARWDQLQGILSKVDSQRVMDVVEGERLGNSSLLTNAVRTAFLTGRNSGKASSDYNQLLRLLLQDLGFQNADLDDDQTRGRILETSAEHSRRYQLVNEISSLVKLPPAELIRSIRFMAYQKHSHGILPEHGPGLHRDLRLAMIECWNGGKDEARREAAENVSKVESLVTMDRKAMIEHIRGEVYRRPGEAAILPMQMRSLYRSVALALNDCWEMGCNEAQQEAAEQITNLEQENQELRAQRVTVNTTLNANKAAATRFVEAIRKANRDMGVSEKFGEAIHKADRVVYLQRDPGDEDAGEPWPPVAEKGEKLGSVAADRYGLSDSEVHDLSRKALEFRRTLQAHNAESAIVAGVGIVDRQSDEVRRLHEKVSNLQDQLENAHQQLDNRLEAKKAASQALEDERREKEAKARHVAQLEQELEQENQELDGETQKVRELQEQLECSRRWNREIKGEAQRAADLAREVASLESDRQHLQGRVGFLQEKLDQFPRVDHPDDRAVVEFSHAMREKMADARAKGREGWDTEDCSDAQLARQLVAHTFKANGRGNFADVANLAMMLWHRNAPPSELAIAAHQIAHEQVGSEYFSGTIESVQIWGEDLAPPEFVMGDLSDCGPDPQDYLPPDGRLVYNPGDPAAGLPAQWELSGQCSLAAYIRHLERLAERSEANEYKAQVMDAVLDVIENSSRDSGEGE